MTAARRPLVALLLTAQLVCPQKNSPAPAPPPSESPPEAPPLPPQYIEPLSEKQISKLARRISAPPPSPPYGSTEAGQREEGRGWLLAQKLKAFLDERFDILRGGEPPAIRAALAEISMMALESTVMSGGRTSWESGVHPVAFRKACVAGASRSAHGGGSIVEAVAALLAEDTDAETKALALQCLEAIAADDPTTDVDNNHALAICATGAVPRIVALLTSPSLPLRARAAAATAALSENSHCAKMLTGASAVTPLLSLARHGDDEGRRHALAGLRMLAIDRDAREKIAETIAEADGGASLLAGLARYGPAELRAAAVEFEDTLKEKQTVSLDARAHAKQARQTRVGQSKLRSSRLQAPVRRAVAPEASASRAGSEEA